MISLNESILIIGKAETLYKVNNINQIKSNDEALKYGKYSELYTAYSEASNIGAQNIYLLNMQYVTDYDDIIASLVQNDFTYIVPINMFFSDKIYSYKLNRKIYFPEYLLMENRNNNLSTIILTDKHAYLYEDIDHYIKSMESEIERFKKYSINIGLYGRNLVFVGNNLKDYNYANVVTAAMLSISKLKDYPLHDCGEAIYDIDYHDIRLKEFCFFKYNVKQHATIENFNNFSTENDQDKFVPINRVIKYLQHYLDLSEYCGKLYNNYVKINIKNRLTYLLNKLVGEAITDFEVVSCDFVIDKRTNTIVILNRINITPINSLEKYQIEIKV